MGMSVRYWIWVAVWYGVVRVWVWMREWAGRSDRPGGSSWYCRLCRLSRSWALYIIRSLSNWSSRRQLTKKGIDWSLLPLFKAGYEISDTL